MLNSIIMNYIRFNLIYFQSNSAFHIWRMFCIVPPHIWRQTFMSSHPFQHSNLIPINSPVNRMIERAVVFMGDSVSSHSIYNQFWSRGNRKIQITNFTCVLLVSWSKKKKIPNWRLHFVWLDWIVSVDPFSMIVYLSGSDKHIGKTLNYSSSSNFCYGLK